MSTARIDAAAGAVSRAAHRRTTQRLLGCGVATAPLFVGLSGLQALTRDGFDISRHPLSLLSLGPGGWLQIANFVATGLLVLAYALGMRRLLHGGPGGSWGPPLVALLGAGLVAAGVFVADPASGFPPGTPTGDRDAATWHGTAHSVAAAIAIDPALVACLVLARRFAGRHERGWAAYSLATAVAGLLVSWWPTQDGSSVRLAVTATIVLAWVSLTAARLRRESAG